MAVKDRTGVKNVNNSGHLMTVLNYRNKNDIDIIFEDGLILYNRLYYDFSKGNVKKPMDKTGENTLLMRVMKLKL